MYGFLMGEALRDLRRGGRVAASAVVLIALSLVALGGFWLLSANLGHAVSHWRERVRIIVYLKREPARTEVGPLLERIQAIPGVTAARYTDKAEALEALKRVLGKEAAVADQLPSNPLPASVDVTPAAAGSTPEGARALLTRLAALPEVEEVAGGIDWVERLAHWQRLLTTIGVGVGVVLALAAILTVTTATTLVLHARRHETEIMRLVGAPEAMVRLPMLLQGMMQGLLGAALAVVALLAGYTAAAARLEPLVHLTLGLPGIAFLPPQALLALIAGGTVLGGFGGWLARGKAEA